jgi:hypothetical protein
MERISLISEASEVSQEVKDVSCFQADTTSILLCGKGLPDFLPSLNQEFGKEKKKKKKRPPLN